MPRSERRLPLRRSARRAVAATWIAFLALIAAWQVQAVPEDYAKVLWRLPSAIRVQLQQQAQRWAGWTPAQRADFTRRAAQWDALPAEERAQRRAHYQAWQALPAEERAQALAAAARYAALPADQQRALRAQFDALDRSQRNGWRLGPSLGADYPALQPLLAQLPAAEHDAVLRTLRALTPQQRKDLGMLVQRTPPQNRAQLRTELIASTASGRAAWFAKKLQE